MRERRRAISVPLGRNASAPYFSAALRQVSSPTVESMMTLVAGTSTLRRRVACNPSRRGRSRSMRQLGKEVAFRGEAAFARPEVYEALEARGLKYAIRIPANDSLERDIGELP